MVVAELARARPGEPAAWRRALQRTRDGDADRFARRYGRADRRCDCGMDR